MSEYETLRGQLIEEDTLISVDELCRCCTIEVEDIITRIMNERRMQTS